MFGISERDLSQIRKLAVQLEPNHKRQEMGSWGILFLLCGCAAGQSLDWKATLVKEYTEPLTTIGGQQDEMVGECRWVVKALRQKAGILLATDPRMAPIAAEIRARTQKMLRGGAAYEGGRH